MLLRGANGLDALSAASLDWHSRFGHSGGLALNATADGEREWDASISLAAQSH
jgi:hypothetical protein